MYEINNKNFEPDFLNVLNEQESTLILGDTKENGCNEYCEGYEPSCRSFICPANTCTCNGICYNDCSCDGDCRENSQITTYYWFAVSRPIKEGYYKSDFSEAYPLDSARCKYMNTVSAASSVYSAICISLATNSESTANLAKSGKTKIYISGTSSSIVGSTGGSLASIGYILINASATTHFNKNNYITVYARSFTSNTTFTSSYNTIITSSTLPSGSEVYIPEKTFTIDVYSGTHLVQGVEVSINNINVIFPQYENMQSNLFLRTGLLGRIVLCTSATTSTTITGNVKRKGFNNYQAQRFTATQNTTKTIQLTPGTQSGNNETIIESNANLVSPEFIRGMSSNNYLNLTKAILNNNYSMQSETFNGHDSSSYRNEVLTFRNTKAITPASDYYVNDPVFGKQIEYTYHATGKTLTSTLQQYAEIPWMNDKNLRVSLPLVINNSSEQSVELTFIANVETGSTSSTSTDFIICSTMLNPNTSYTNEVLITWYGLTGSIVDYPTEKSLKFKAKIEPSISIVTLSEGNYQYIQSEGQNPK